MGTYTPSESTAHAYDPEPYPLLHPSGPSAKERLDAERAAALEYYFNGGGGDLHYLGVQVSSEREHER
jgi:hypothetical protein